MTTALCGSVTRVFYSNAETGWMAGKLRRDDAPGEVSFAGKVVAEVGDTVELTGAWQQHPKYGRQFEAETGIVRMDESPEALIHLLASRDEFTGIGPARAEKIVRTALSLSRDGDLAQALSDWAAEIARRVKVPRELVDRAAEEWNSRRGTYEALARVVSLGWSSAQARAIVETLGENAASIVRADPYLLVGRVARFGFRTVDAVAQVQGSSPMSRERYAAGIAYCLDRIAQSGHTWTTREDLLHEATQELRPETLEAEEMLEATVDEMIGLGALAAHEVDAAEVIADARLAEHELEVLRRLTEGLGDSHLPELDLGSPAAAEKMATLNDGQRAALLGIATHRYAVLSGGAGVGKTYTTDAICTIAEANGLKVALCAPTGKAARRLTDGSGRDASTIHRLLEPIYQNSEGGFAFQRTAEKPLEVDLVVVDEVSMVDVRLMAALLDALPGDARLLLVGDHHQIPSVGPGAILRDILSMRRRFSHSIHVLDEVVRQAGDLERNTSAILDGVVAKKSSDVWRVSTHTSEADSADEVIRTVESLLVSSDLDPAWDIQVLAPMKKGDLGTHALNTRLQALRQRMLGNPPPLPPDVGKPPKPVVGDRVIWTKNDYRLELHNGTQAIVSKIDRDGTMHLLVEDGREVAIKPGDRKNVELAYCLTIHRSQGSEWPAVVLALSSRHYIMADRALLYTGASRAAQSLTMIGDSKGIGAFASKRRASARQTFGSFVAQGWQPEEN